VSPFGEAFAENLILTT